jgi:hypothetical protein
VVDSELFHNGALLPELIDTDNTASDVWADTASAGGPALTSRSNTDSH